MRHIANLVGADSFAPMPLSAGGHVGVTRPDELMQDFLTASKINVGSAALDAALRAVLAADVMAGGPDAPAARGDRLYRTGMPGRSTGSCWIEFEIPDGPLRNQIPVRGSSRFGCLFSPGRADDAWETRAVMVATEGRDRAYALPTEIRYDAEGTPLEPGLDMDPVWELLEAVGTVAAIASAALAAKASGILSLVAGPSLEAENKGRAKRGKRPLLSCAELVVAA